MSLSKMVRIGNAGGYWGDDPYALRRQVTGELPLDYVSMDFLAEITMSILQKQHARDPEAGYARDFVTQIAPLLKTILDRGIRVITNAGGVNPVACARALLAAAKEQSLPLRVAVIDGDNITPRIAELRRAGESLSNLESGEDLSAVQDKVLSANVYFGALPVVEALRADPHVVLSGRVTDTGITLGALIHEFGWAADDYDRLAYGIVGAHLIECGAQATGGNFTDWCKVPSYVEVGFPILEYESGGTFVLTKHPGSGGLVSCQTTREQLLYEMGHPQLYVTPDVIADFSRVEVSPDGEDRVRITGARGRPPTDLLKVSMALEGGHKASGAIIVSGPDARAKAEVFSQVFWTRMEAELGRAGLEPFTETLTEYVGHDSTHGPLTPSMEPTEILLRLGARDPDREKLAIFRKLLPSLILSGPAGVAVTGGAPTISEVVRYWPALLSQEHAPASVAVYEQGASDPVPRQVGEPRTLHWPATGGVAEISEPVSDPYPRSLVEPFASARLVDVPLMRIAHARSGDKGDTANIGLIGRSAECYVWLRENIDARKVKEWFQGICRGHVERHLVPRLWALNFLLDQSLGGGGTVSLHIDAQGKTYSQALLRCRVRVPEPLLTTIASEDAPCPGELGPGEPAGGGGR